MSNIVNKMNESLDVNFDGLKGEFINILLDYEKSSSKLLKILKIGEKQQKKVKDLNELLNRKTVALGELNEVLEYKFKLEVAKNRTKDKESLKILKSLLDANPNPTIIYNKSGIVKFVNEAFKEIITKKNVIQTQFNIDSIINRSSKLSILNSIDSFMNFDSKSVAKVVLNCDVGRKIFSVIKKEIPLRNGEDGFVYTLNDITIMEYQRLMLDDYTKKLEKYLLQVKRESSADLGVTNSDDKLYCDISNDDKEILNRQTNYKLSALVFMSEIDCELLAELDDLKDILVDMSNLLLELDKSKEIKDINIFGDYISKFASRIRFLSEFDDLIFSLSKLSDMLKKRQIWIV